MNDFVALGFDGGGTRSRAVLVNSGGEIIGVGSAGPSNLKSVGLEMAIRSLEETVSLAWKDSGLRERPADAAFLGFAGAGAQEDRELLKQSVIQAKVSQPEKLAVDHDLRIALAGALGGDPGIVIVSGTGSAVYGRTADGLAGQAGGWGWLLGDPGSGYWLGRQALKAVVKEADGRGKPTSLTPAMAAHFGLDSIHGSKEKLYEKTRGQGSVLRIAALAPVVIAAAENGDEVAGEIVRSGCSELANMALAVARKLGFETEPVAISAIGGVAGSGRFFTSALETALAAILPDASLQPPLLPPVLGAALFAMEVVYDGPIQDLAASLENHPKASGLW